MSLDRQTVFIEAKQQALIGNLDGALEKFLELEERAPGDDAVAFELSRLYKAREQPNDAIDWLKKAYAANPNENYAAYLAELLQANGRYAEGAELMADMARRDPTNPGYYLDQAEFLTLNGDAKGAIKVYEELEGRIGVNEMVTRLKYAIYLAEGDTKRAEKELLALIDAKPDVLRYRHLLAGFYQAQNDEGAAAKVYRDILRREPNDVRAQLALQTAAPARTGTNGDELLAAMRNTSIDLDLKIGRLLPEIQALAKKNNSDGANPQVQGDARLEQAAMELARVHPDDPKATALLGDYYTQTGQAQKAATAYKTTLDLDDSRWAVWEQLLAALYTADDARGLREYGERALDVFPNRPTAYVYYALGELLRGDYNEAGYLLDQTALMLADGSPGAASVATLRAVIDAFAGGNFTPEDVNASQIPGGESGPLGVIITQADDLAALKAYDEAHSGSALFLEVLGRANAAAGDDTAAAEAYSRARAAGSKSPTLPQ